MYIGYDVSNWLVYWYGSSIPIIYFHHLIWIMYSAISRKSTFNFWVQGLNIFLHICFNILKKHYQQKIANYCHYVASHQRISCVKTTFYWNLHNHAIADRIVWKVTRLVHIHHNIWKLTVKIIKYSVNSNKCFVIDVYESNICSRQLHVTPVMSNIFVWNVSMNRMSVNTRRTSFSHWHWCFNNIQCEVHMCMWYIYYNF